MDAFEKVARYLKDPLVLIGFVVFVAVGLFREFLTSDRLAPTVAADTGQILLTIVWVVGILAFATILLGFFHAHRRSRPTLDAGSIVASIKEHGRKEAQWEQERGELARRNAELEDTVRQLVEQSSRPDSPPGLANALAEAQKTGDPSGVVTVLTRNAEILAADARQSNRAAAANLRQAATLVRWTDTRAALAAIRRATELDPADLNAWIERGRLEMQAGDRPAAHRSFATALERAKVVGDERMEGVASHEIGVVLLAAGDLKAALAAFDSYKNVAERLAARDPSNAEWQNDLSISYNKLGDVRAASGDLAGARKSYEAGLAIAEHLAARDPSNAGWQRDLSISHGKLGDVRVASGDLARAGHSYETGLAIAERLAARDPSNAGWQRDLSISYERLGDLRVASGDLARAGHSYEAGLAIRERLATGDPSNAEWQRDLSVSHNKLGDLRVASGDLAGACRSYEADLAIAERLAERDPSNAEWQRDLSVSHDRLGNVRVASGDLAGAGQSYEAGLVIRERLAVGDPSNADWQRDLSVSHEKFGNVRVASGDLAGARQSYEASLAIRERLAACDPSNVAWQRDRVVSYWNIAGVQARLPDGREEALGWYRRALGVVEVMKAAGRWAPRDEPFVGTLRERISALETGDAAAPP